MTDIVLKNYAAALNDRVDELVQATDEASVQNVLDRTAAEVARNTPLPNTFVYKATVLVLGASVLSVIAGQILITLTPNGPPIPDGLIAIGSAAIGALAGLLAPVGSR